jgi:3-methyladenine DNA glycosylase/8-oxoguanine DNA glycosylase
VRTAPRSFARATLTPDGPGLVTVTWSAPPGEGTQAVVEATGDGAAWLAARAPRLLGVVDDVTGFAPGPPLRNLWRRHTGLRMTATGTLWHDLAWTIVQQRVHRRDAAEQWRRLVLELGVPVGASGLVAPPAPLTVARLTYPRLHPLGIERQRAEYLIEAARAVGRLQHLTDEPFGAALPVLRSLRGVGAWTSACLAAFTWGEPDTVVLGDAGIPSMVTWLLAREPRGDDARMLELLEPYRPHRARVVRLVLRSGLRPPRYAPRRRGHDIRHR